MSAADSPFTACAVQLRQRQSPAAQTCKRCPHFWAMRIHRSPSRPMRTSGRRDSTPGISCQYRSEPCRRIPTLDRHYLRSRERFATRRLYRYRGSKLTHWESTAYMPAGPRLSDFPLKARDVRASIPLSKLTRRVPSPMVPGDALKWRSAWPETYSRALQSLRANPPT